MPTVSPTSKSVHQPTSTPGPNPVPRATLSPTPTLAPTATTVPAATPQPAATLAPTSPPSPQEPTLVTDPAGPIAGREVALTLSHLQPWERVEITLIDPTGQIVTQVSHRNDDWDPVPLVVYADGEGVVRWSRHGPQDKTGDWTVRAKTGNRLLTFQFSLDELELEGSEPIFLGAPMRGYHGEAARVFFSDSVPAALAVDLEGQLALTARVLEDALGTDTSAIPDLYVSGNHLEFWGISDATGRPLRRGDGGYFKCCGLNPGIYMMTDPSWRVVQHVATHEYVHFVLSEITDTRSISAWLNEGIAQYYAFRVGLLGPSPEGPESRMNSAADLARDAALEDRLFPLLQIGSWYAWRPEADGLAVKYARATWWCAI